MLDYITKLPDAAYANRWPRRVVLLGSTGSIGCSSLAVMAEQPEYFTIVALAGGKNFKLLAEQAASWRPLYLAVQDEDTRTQLLPLLDYKPEILVGQEGYSALAALPETDVVLSAQVGAAGLKGTVAAAVAGKVIILANKESLVLAGDILREACRASGASILPADSEHNAIFQCLAGYNPLAGLSPDWLQNSRTSLEQQFKPEFKPSLALKRIILTASGGPFRGRDKAFLSAVRKKDALAHPTWSMGTKITIDSATMMNKGLEIIEACHLYGLQPEEVEVLVHPQSVIHSLIELQDNSQIAQLGEPDMRIPLANCLGWPYRVQSGAAELNLLGRKQLDFEALDEKVFTAPDLCRKALREGRGLPIALNAANEVAVTLFLEDKLTFTGISELVATVLENWQETKNPQELETVLYLDTQARILTRELARKWEMRKKQA